MFTWFVILLWVDFHLAHYSPILFLLPLLEAHRSNIHNFLVLFFFLSFVWINVVTFYILFSLHILFTCDLLLCESENFIFINVVTFFPYFSFLATEKFVFGGFPRRCVDKFRFRQDDSDGMYSIPIDHHHQNRASTRRS